MGVLTVIFGILFSIRYSILILIIPQYYYWCVKNHDQLVNRSGDVTTLHDN